MSPEEIAMDRQALDYILYSYLWNGTSKDSLILMDTLSLILHKHQLAALDGSVIEIGVIEHWENEVDGLKDDQDGLNEFYRQYPRYDRARI